MGHPDLLQDVEVYLDGMLTEYEAYDVMEKFVQRVLNIEETTKKKKSSTGSSGKAESGTPSKNKSGLRPQSGVLDMIQPSRKSGQAQYQVSVTEPQTDDDMIDDLFKTRESVIYERR